MSTVIDRLRTLVATENNESEENIKIQAVDEWLEEWYDCWSLTIPRNYINIIELLKDACNKDDYEVYEYYEGKEQEFVNVSGSEDLVRDGSIDTYVRYDTNGDGHYEFSDNGDLFIVKIED